MIRTNQTTLVTLLISIFLASCSSYTQKHQTGYGNASYISEGIVRSFEIQANATMYIAETGKLPSSNQQLGLSSPEAYADTVLKSIQVLDGGIIRLTYTALSGVDGGIIDYKPEKIGNSRTVTWNCTTPSFKGIEAWRPDCHYTN
ncbi:pilin [Gilvimarinus chinensis]|uniref:pilin n=1 Tax=Gilvimarinus chinensis TaxID=396005 RepID=UPI000369250A|nr:pilin [Gilvimarinus chinensis]